MEATSLRSLVLSPSPYVGKSHILHQKMGFINFKSSQLIDRRDPKANIVHASNKRDAYGRDYDGKVVDENMIILRMRIHEMKMEETHQEPPSHWMEWEKQYFANYYSDVCEAMGFLQSQLMNARPSLALGVVALVMLSVPSSMVFIMFHLVEIAKVVLAGSP
ncbi:hypothetical protein RGQ29_002166 [Quercus rubra]|uniref:Uncharacterized protein n=1 Tax=Quercus rubra TaxID=3512 RepID=A0AAN7J863_QUERU|nr:hypothetical protein RGQ29_002166 [Quercus rubra]